MAISKGQFPNRNSYLPHIPKPLRKVINTALNVDQSKRHQTILHLINELSSINSLLDWKYSISNNDFIWTLDIPDKIFTVTLSNNNGVFSVVTEKRIKTSGNTTRVAAGCKAIINQPDIDKTIQNILLSLE
ncbi:hypothetical protein D3C86_1619810 [compost metagenome]